MSLFKKIFFTLVLSLSFLFPALSLSNPVSQAPEKKFKRALVFGGGGITPGVLLGMMTASRDMGWNPDVVLTTCGSSMGAAIYNSFLNPEEGLKYAKSQAFHKILKKIKVQTPNALDLLEKLHEIKVYSTLVPNYFSENVLNLNDHIEGFLPNPEFNQSSQGPRFVILAAKSPFQPKDVGERKKPTQQFVETFFTDPDTAQALRGLKSPVKQLFPKSHIADETQVIDNDTTEHAARASISDPHLINPAHIGENYYMTGAVDLYPIEVAEQLADDIVVTYPDDTFTANEDYAVSSTFGFSQNQRLYKALEHKNVKWIDTSKISDTELDPKLFLIWVQNEVPSDLQAFQDAVDRQYKFGYRRMKEALRIQKNRINARFFLRNPIEIP